MYLGACCFLLILSCDIREGNFPPYKPCLKAVSICCQILSVFAKWLVKSSSLFLLPTHHSKYDLKYNILNKVFYIHYIHFGCLASVSFFLPFWDSLASPLYSRYLPVLSRIREKTATDTAPCASFLWGAPALRSWKKSPQHGISFYTSTELCRVKENFIASLCPQFYLNTYN